MKTRKWPFYLALAHTLILACYALPDNLVTERLRYWSTTYTRPLFHQQWNLFAPDVPPCSCTIMVKSDTGSADLMEGRGWLGRRIVKWGCRSMSNYRNPLEVVSVRSWPGFDQYMHGLTEGYTAHGVWVERWCAVNEGPRVLFQDSIVAP